MRLAAPKAQEIAVSLLVGHGVPEPAARLQADLLVEAELRALPSHGLQRLPRLISRLTKGLASATATGQHDWRAPGFLAVDGQRGLGPVVLMAALDALADRVATNGLALAAIRNSNHIGMLAYYVEAAAKRGLTGIAMTSSEALVHPFGGTQALLGTNPIAIGIPTGDAPFVLDLATSLVSMGKIHNHALRGEPLEPGWAVDAEGQPTLDATRAKMGAIAPFGGAKGYGLGLAVELLVATLAGSDFAPKVHGTLDDTAVANKGDLLILIDPTRGDGRTAGIAAYLNALRASQALDPAHPVSVPGDGARARRARALTQGIDLPDPLYAELTDLLTQTKEL